MYVELQALPEGASMDDTFTYRATDGELVSNVATVTIHVTGVNDAPVATMTSTPPTEDAVLTLDTPDVLENDWDVDDGDAIDISDFDRSPARSAQRSR